MFGPHLPTAMGLPHACTHTLSGCVEWGCAHTPRARCAHSVGRKPIVELWERCGLTLTHRALRTSHACRACSGVPVWVWRCQEMRGGCPALAPPPRVSGVVPPQGPHLASPCLRARSAAWLAMLDADSRPASPHISPYLEALDAAHRTCVLRLALERTTIPPHPAVLSCIQPYSTGLRSGPAVNGCIRGACSLSELPIHCLRPSPDFASRRPRLPEILWCNL